MKYPDISRQQAVRFAEAKTILYGCAYRIDNQNLRAINKSMPVKGILLKDGHDIVFAILKKDGKPRESGWVNYRSRDYADTYDESVELFNARVQDRCDKLEQILNDARTDFLREGD